MFLVNSRQILFAAALEGFNTSKGAPSPEVTELICRIPLTELLRHALAFSARGTSVRSRYGHLAVLFTGPWVQPTYAITDSPASRHYGSPQDSLLRRRDNAARPALRRQS